MGTRARRRAFGWGAATALHLALGLVWLCLAAAAPTEREGGAEAWDSLSAQGLTVDHRREDARYASRVLEIYRERGQRTAESMGLRSLAPLKVVIAAPRWWTFRKVSHLPGYFSRATLSALRLFCENF